MRGRWAAAVLLAAMLAQRALFDALVSTAGAAEGGWSLTGEWVGDYGQLGSQRVEVFAFRSGAHAAVKRTGDRYVPAGEATWVLQSGKALSRKGGRAQALVQMAEAGFAAPRWVRAEAERLDAAEYSLDAGGFTMTIAGHSSPPRTFLPQRALWGASAPAALRSGYDVEQPEAVLARAQADADRAMRCGESVGPESLVVTGDLEVFLRVTLSESTKTAWTYQYSIAVRNLGQQSVRLVARHWQFSDELGTVIVVKGPTVGSNTAVIPPGQGFNYSSHTTIGTPEGAMYGAILAERFDGVAEAGTPAPFAAPLGRVLLSPKASRRALPCAPKPPPTALESTSLRFDGGLIVGCVGDYLQSTDTATHFEVEFHILNELTVPVQLEKLGLTVQDSKGKVHRQTAMSNSIPGLGVLAPRRSVQHRMVVGIPTTEGVLGARIHFSTGSATGINQSVPLSAGVSPVALASDHELWLDRRRFTKVDQLSEK